MDALDARAVVPKVHRLRQTTRSQTRPSSDNICKVLAATYPEQLIEWLFGTEGVEARVLKTEISREPIRADSVILLASEDTVFHVEFQTAVTSDPPLPLRMLDYYVVYQILRGGDMLEESSVYQDILKKGIQQGVRKGERRLVIRQLELRLGKLSAKDRSRIDKLSTAEVERLAEALLDFSSQADVNEWLTKTA